MFESCEYSRRVCPAYEINESGRRRGFYIDITLKNGVLSMCGRWRSLGQISNDLTNEALKLSEGFEHSDIFNIQNIWNRWHLNDKRAGTPKQEAFIRQWKLSNRYDYSAACDALAKVGLLYDNGYKYGSSWLKEELPIDVIEYLFSLPAVSGTSWIDIAPPPINETEFFNILQVGVTKLTDAL